jgi:hypothetical protein
MRALRNRPAFLHGLAEEGIELPCWRAPYRAFPHLGLRQFQRALVHESADNYCKNMKAFGLFYVINKKVTRFCPLEYFS